MISNMKITINKSRLVPNSLKILLFVGLFYLVALVNGANQKAPWEYGTSDISYEYQAATELKSGVNPYERILSGDLLINRKYATLFPLYYYFLLLVASFSKYDFYSFLGNYRNILFVSEIVSAFFIYLMFKKRGLTAVGLLALSFFVLNRWTINSISDLKQDFIAISLLLASLYFFEAKPRLSYFLYGFSLGVKHLGIFIFPIYLTPFIFKSRKLKDFLFDLLVMLIPILGPAIPFLLDKPKAFLFSMLFSFTRKPATTSITFGFDRLLVLYNVGVSNNKVFYYLLPRLPLLIFSLFNVYLLFAKKIQIYPYMLFSVFIFISFNPVLFDQYFIWLAPFTFLSVLDHIKSYVNKKV